MKRVMAILAVTAGLAACGDNNVGNRTYDMDTRVDSAAYPTTNTHDDTTATILNNAYNPDSMPQNGTLENLGSGAAPRNNESAEQQRINAGPNIPQNTKGDSTSRQGTPQKSSKQ